MFFRLSCLLKLVLLMCMLLVVRMLFWCLVRLCCFGVRCIREKFEVLLLMLMIRISFLCWM